LSDEGLTVIEVTLSPAGRPVASSVMVSWPEGTVNGLLHRPPTTDTVLAEPLTLNRKVEPVMPLAPDLQISRAPSALEALVAVVVLVLAVAAEATSGKVPTTSVRAARAPNRRTT
jgi:hypothetical protein